MKRRAFLKLFGQAAVAVTAAPVLARVPEKTYPEQLTDVELLWPGIKKMRDQNYDSLWNDRATALAKSMRETREKVATDVLYGLNK